MASGILGVALTGLNAAQAGIRTTEHNIANVNTAGYRRQEVDYAALQPMYTGAGYFGNGVGVDMVRSLYSQFLDNDVLLNQTQVSKYDAYASGATQIDKMLGDSGSGLSTAMDSFFSAVNEVANDPTSNVARQVLISAGNNLAGRINTLDTQFRNFISSSNNEIGSIVGQANLFASQIASLNNDIARAEAANGGTANDLRDQRQQLIGELNKLVNVSLVQQPDGSTNVYIGSGQPLVMGNRAYTLSTAIDPNDSSLRVPTIDVGGSTLTLSSDLVTGGKLGGLLALREEVVLPAFKDLNRIAVAIGAEVNRVHRGGLDYNLNAGGDFFSAVVQQTAGAGRADVVLTGNSLANDNFTVSYDGTNYTVTRVSDSAAVTVAAGVEVTLGGVPQGFKLAAGTPAPAAGNAWTLNFKDYARGMATQLSDASQVAAAGAGADGPGDGTNALAMAALRYTATLDTVTFNAAYNQTIGRTASLASNADLNLSAFTSLASSAESASRSVSGVNLDEEAVNLIRFQQAYQAAAKAIQVASSLFDEILGIVR